MDQQKCFRLLEFDREGSPDIEVTIGSMECAITQSIASRLVDSAEEIEEFRPCIFDSRYLLLKRGEQLLFVDIYMFGESPYFYVSGQASVLLSVLSDDRLLHKIIDQSIVTELERLQAQEKADRLLDAEKREIAERDRLIAKHGLPSASNSVNTRENNAIN